MIRSISIENYQSHKNTTLGFDKGVNIIIGSSDSGKTAILRALNWVVNNKPSGEAFRSKWGGDTIVGILIDKYDIKRTRGKTNNEYLITTKDNIMYFKALGQGVPEEVEQILNISEINQQDQHDSPFLLSSSSGEVARYLNRIVKLDVIDTAMANINKTFNEEKRRIEYERNNLNNMLGTLKEFDWVEEAEGRLKTLEMLEDTLMQKTHKRNSLEGLISHIENKEDEIAEINEVVKWEKMVDLYIEQNKKIQEKESKLHLLNEMIDEIRISQNAITDLTSYVNLTQKEFDEIFPDICPLCGSFVKGEGEGEDEER